MLMGTQRVVSNIKLTEKQIERAAIQALNGIAFDAQQDVRNKLPQWLNIKRPFLPRSVIVNKATPQKDYAEVGFAKEARLVPWLEKGGVLTAQQKGKRVITIPVEAKRGKKGNVARSQYPSRLVQSGRAFSRTISGVSGIWQKLKRGPIKLMWAYIQRATYKKGTIRFEDTVVDLAKRQYDKKFSYWINRLVRPKK